MILKTRARQYLICRKDTIILQWKNLTRRNVILKRVLCFLVPPIYPLLCKGYRNEDCRYALLLLAMEVVSFKLDLIGGAHWGYLLASFLWSVLILETTIYAYFNKISRIKIEAQQLMAVEIVFSVLQLIISCYCLIKTLSGVKTNSSSLVFPLAYATISVVFTFKSKRDVSDSSSDTPSNQAGIVNNTAELELESIRVDRTDTPVDNVDPLDQSLVSVPISDAKVDPLDPTSDSVPASDAQVDPLDPTLAFVPTSSAIVPQANTLRKRGKQSHFRKLVFKVELTSEIARMKAIKTLSDISGVYTIQVDMMGKRLTLIASQDVDSERAVKKLRKQCYAELISVGPAEQPKTSEEN